MNLTDRFPHIRSMRMCPKSHKLYIVVAHDVAKDIELVDLMEQNYMMAYSLVPEGSESLMIPDKTYLVSSISIGGD